MVNRITIEALSRAAFAPYGDLIDAGGKADALINAGRCERFHDLARLDVDDGSRVGISVFRSEACTLPYTLTLVERHPLGSQAFLPLSADPFLVIVAADAGGLPSQPRAFLTGSGQGVNLHRNVWHGVLTPLRTAATFAVVDRIGEGPNLEEHHLDPPFIVQVGASGA